jgi:hypothetical protein
MSRSSSPSPSPSRSFASTAPTQKAKDNTGFLIALDRKVKTLEALHAAKIATLEAQIALLMTKIDSLQKPSEPTAKPAPTRVFHPIACTCPMNPHCTYGEEKCKNSKTGKAKAAGKA